ncbi:HlyD family secretion protein [Enterovibrio norvegicus]|uniref:HlyD family secretion protein n=1 Tax=Enterovibrio norvegicus TaxID=188144 RepID=UPI0035508B0F
MPSTGLITVKATQNGVIEELYVEDGHNISKLDALFKINSEIFDRNGDSVHERLMASILQQHATLKNQQEYEKLMNNSSIGELESKISRLLLEIKSAQLSLEFAKERTILKRQAKESYITLLKNNYISDLSYKEFLSSLVGLQAEEENKHQLIQQLERERIASQHQLDYISLQGSMRALELERQLDSLQQQQIELTTMSETKVNAPISGEVTTLRAENGQSVNQGDVILNIIPKEALMQVELYAPSKAIGFLRTGQKVGLRFDAYPYEKFGVQQGNVVSISKSTLSPLELKSQDQTIRVDTETLYKVVVSLEKPTINIYGNEEPLKVGMKVNSDIAVETRKLYEWLLGPIARLKGMNQ